MEGEAAVQIVQNFLIEIAQTRGLIDNAFAGRLFWPRKSRVNRHLVAHFPQSVQPKGHVVLSLQTDGEATVDWANEADRSVGEVKIGEVDLLSETLRGLHRGSGINELFEVKSETRVNLSIHSSEVLEPYDLAHVEPVVFVQIGTGHDHSDELVKFVENQFRVEYSKIDCSAYRWLVHYIQIEVFHFIH